MILVASSLATGLWWINYTGYIEEDAFITFRFAQQIADGNGFVYNLGEPIYGTTTPLLTILLAGWLKYFSDDIVLGARILNLLAFCGTLFFTWRTLRTLRRSAAEQVFPLFAILLSPRLLYMSTQGMEMPLVTFFMAASWYACTTGRTKWTGFLCGLLLWTRVDLIFWPIILLVVSGIHNLKNAITIALIAGLTYLPWIIFATLYFGSPIPHTVIAKWVAYSLFNASPYSAHLGIILNYLSLINISGSIRFIGPVITFAPVAWAMGRRAIAREKTLLILLVFVAVEVARLTLTRATFFNRYFVPILWATLVLFGVGLGVLWDTLRPTRNLRYIFDAALILILLAAVGSWIPIAESAKARQIYRFERSLKEIGLWLNQNSDLESTILLEPLGYIGYYSERQIIDEVGLVTPEVVEIKLQQIESDRYPSIFHPDYIILHCDDASRLASDQETGLAQDFTLAQEFNPLVYNSATLGQQPDPNEIARNSCYQIWQEIR
jgi:hypothetical protein